MRRCDATRFLFSMKGNGLKGDVDFLRVSLERKLGIKLDDDGDHNGLRFVLSQRCGLYLSTFFSRFTLSRLRGKRV